MIVKIIDINKNGVIDYKGLNIDLFVAGSQFYYKENDIENCLVKTKEDLTEFKHDNVIKIIDDEYWNIIKKYKAKPELTKEQEKILELEQKIKEQNQAIADLTTMIAMIQTP